MPVRTGLDRLLEGGLSSLKNKNVAVVCNHTAVDGSLVHLIERLVLEGVSISTVLGPEHGLYGCAQDMEAVAHEVEPMTGLAVKSLYGSGEESLMPTVEALKGVDVVVFDIQDVGARYYTYVWTMVLVMRRCAELGIRMMVLDRPNPIGGVVREGGGIEAGFTSFVGLKSVANRHGFTAGEIAQWAKASEKLDIDLEIVWMEGWKRKQWFEQTDLPWVSPSPNMPTLETAVIYPGMCLLEATNLSEGRGTTKPFEYFGAPYIDSRVLIQKLRAHPLPGVTFRPMSFKPKFQKHADKTCHGAQIHVVDRELLASYRLGIFLIWAVHDEWPQAFAWRRDPYEFVEDVPAMDLLCGSAKIREAIEGGENWQTIEDIVRQREGEFSAGVQEYYS